MTTIKVFGEEAKKLAARYGMAFGEKELEVATHVILRLDSVEGRDIVEVEV